jgi:uncharacterized protein (TIGR02611 family)
LISVLRRISEQRHKLIIERAEPFLEDGENVLQWVRARRPDGRGAGFIYLTVRRVIIVWTGKPDDDSSAKWEEITSWGLQPDAKGGPLLGVETSRGSLFAQVVAATGQMAQDVGSFVRRFSQLAGEPKAPLDHPKHGPFHHHTSLDVHVERRSIGGLTKRFMITLLGAVMISVGFLIIPLPGPWSLPLILGGLAVLGGEYDWAKDTLEWTKAKYKKARNKFRSRNSSAT